MLRIIAIILGISLLMRLLSQSNIKKLADLVFDLILNFIAYLLTLDWLEGWVFSAIVKYYIEVFIEAIKKASIRSPHRSLNVLKLPIQFKDKYNYIILRFTKKFNSLSSEDKKFLSDVCMNIFGLTIIALINFTMLFLMIEYNI